MPDNAGSRELAPALMRLQKGRRAPSRPQLGLAD
jgi:hypothetical protein